MNVRVACRDADETKEWIEEKNQALNTDNYGHDLASVQALQRKHEGFERDLAALGDKVRGCRVGFLQLPLKQSQVLQPTDRGPPFLAHLPLPSPHPGKFPWGNSRAPDPVAPRVGRGPPGEVHRVKPGVEQPGEACRPAQSQAGRLARPAALPQRLPVRGPRSRVGPSRGHPPWDRDLCQGRNRLPNVTRAEYVCSSPESAPTPARGRACTSPLRLPRGTFSP